MYKGTIPKRGGGFLVPYLGTHKQKKGRPLQLTATPGPGIAELSALSVGGGYLPGYTGQGLAPCDCFAAPE